MKPLVNRLRTAFSRVLNDSKRQERAITFALGLLGFILIVYYNDSIGWSLPTYASY